MPTLHWLTRDTDIHAAAHVPYRLLEEALDLSTGDPDADNMLIQGDNLEALKALTHSRWPRIRRDFDCYVSALVVQEAKGGDTQAAAAQIAAIAGLPVLQISEDALHIALAACNGIDYLLTWNFTHIHNAQMEVAIRRIVEQHGYQCPVICSPDELIGEEE